MKAKLKLLECPWCGKDATFFLNLFNGFNRFIYSKRCKYCDKKLCFNWRTINEFFLIFFGYAFLLHRLELLNILILPESLEPIWTVLGLVLGLLPAVFLGRRILTRGKDE